MTNAEIKLAKTIDQLALMNDALRLLRLEILPKNSRLFAVLVEGPLTEIKKLRNQIEDQANALAADSGFKPRQGRHVYRTTRMKTPSSVRSDICLVPVLTELNPRLVLIL